LQLQPGKLHVAPLARRARPGQPRGPASALSAAAWGSRGQATGRGRHLKRPTWAMSPRAKAGEVKIGLGAPLQDTAGARRR
jgi:hypothetical protein